MDDGLTSSAVFMAAIRAVVSIFFYLSNFLFQKTPGSVPGSNDQNSPLY